MPHPQALTGPSSNPAAKSILLFEVGAPYSRRQLPEPVRGWTGLWFLLPVIGGYLAFALVEFVKTNGALSRSWKTVAQR